MDDIRWACCFCGEGIPETRYEPVEINLSLGPESSQQLYAHLACLRRALHPNAILGIPDAVDEGWVPE
jgi:hypothetical protein